MKYLSYQRDAAGQVSAVPSETIDWHSTFWRDGNILTLNGMAIGFNVSLFSAKTPGGVDAVGQPAPGTELVFNKVPMADPAFSLVLADTGRIHPQADGSLLIQWPL